MKKDAITLSVGTGTLRVVPAIHYRLYFARIMNRICVDPSTRPSAIAVELAPQAAAFLTQWIEELYSEKKTLPVMLGMTMKCQVIRPTLKNKAFQLQEKFGRDLSEFSLDQLRRELDFCSELMLPISPTDSIIEGIRCAATYGIPLYGIDLDDVPEEERGSSLIQPNQLDVFKNILLNDCVGVASHLPVWGSDRRREVAMAARLKTLLQNHGNVLFSCGMGHWKRIQTLISSPDLRPAIVHENVVIEKGKFQRVIVSPITAVRFIDLFPAIALVWEKYRDAEEGDDAFPKAYEIFETILERAYRDYYLEPSDPADLPENTKSSLYACNDFENYLRNLAMLEHFPVPDLFLTMTAARETMNAGFVKTLLKVFMEYPWVKPADFPHINLPIYMDSERKDGTMVLVSNSESNDRFVRALKEGGSALNLTQEESSIVRNAELMSIAIDTISPFTWLPWDRLITSASIRANTAADNQKDLIPTEFTGSILEGIDIKATLRAHARGNNKLFVREQTVKMSMPEEKLDAFPVVWIFSDQQHEDDRWTLQVFAGVHLRPHVRNRQEFDRLVESGAVMIPLIGYARKNECSIHPRVFYDTFSGISIYHPTCFSNRQQALWLEQMGYGSAPILKDSAMSDMNDIFMKRFKIDLMQYNWKTKLILSAIPFAKSTVTVIAPDGYMIEEFVLETARRFNVTILKTRLSLFKEKELDRLTRCHFSNCLKLEPIYQYSEEVEQIIGERQTDYIQCVPRLVAEFGQLL